MDITSESKIIQSFVDKGNFHAEMNIAISALNECRRNDNQLGTNAFLDIIRHIADTMGKVFRA